MSTIIVPLKDIITDDANPMDLTAIPESEAIEQIRNVYGFLSKSVTVTIEEGIATITVDDVKANQESQAMKTLARASKAAQRGKYRRAIPLFQDVLRTLPDHTVARRELAMALVETGGSAAAKKHLIRVLQLDPNDAWAYLILGNLYYQYEDDLGSADRYYTSAIDLAPDDPYIINSSAVVKAKRGELETAESMFIRAIEVDPAYPNPRHGLALCYRQQGRTEDALAVLQQLFAEPESDDPRHVALFVTARELYMDLIRQRAVDRHDHNLAALEDVFEAYSARTGIGIELQRDESLATTAKVELAWRYQRPNHVIKYKDPPLAGHVYLLTHEFEHVLLDEEARAAGRNRTYACTPQIRAQIMRILDKDIRRLRQRRNFPAEAVDQYVKMVIDGQINQLYNMPLDMVIDSRIHEKYAFARDSQIVSLVREQVQNQQILTDNQMRGMIPKRIFQANVALNGAMALLLDDLSGSATDQAAAYRPSGMLATARRIYDLWAQTMDNWRPGAENDLVDAVATELRMRDWYAWIEEPADAPAPVAPAIPPEGGSTNPDLLKEPQAQMAVTMYMLDALKRYANMGNAEIMQVAGEIALLGQTGLDYSASEHQYTLRFLPGESFSGLQLMSLMYVGFKKVQPDIDTGMPFDDAYAQALSMYEMGM